MLQKQAVQESQKTPDTLPKHTILKTDCQGYDAKAILGSEGLLSQVAVLIAEVGFQVPENQKSVLHLYSMLHNFNFRLAAVSSMLVNKRNIGIQTDMIFVNTSLFNPWNV